MNLKYDDLLKMEKSFIKPVLEKIHRALTTIYEGKTVRVAGSDFDKNILFYVGRDLKTAKFEINEDKVKISNVEDIKVDVMSLKDKFQQTMSEAIDLVSAEKLEEAEVKFGEAVETLRKELAGDKVTIFEKRPPLLKESKVAIKKLQLTKESKINAIKEMAATAKNLMESYFGKTTPANEFEVNLTEGKTVQKTVTASSLIRNIDIAKKAANSIDMKNIFEDVVKFIADNEEVFFLTSDKFKAKICEAAKTNVAATKDTINEAVKTFKKLRNESQSFRKIVNEVMGEAPMASGEIQDKDVPVADKGMEDLDDKVVSDLDRKSEEEKLGFMKQFVDILGKLLEKIKEVTTDDEDVTRRVDFALDTIAKAKEEGRWDKDELAEIAKEAIELAAKIEGIQPEETEISKRSEEGEEEQEMDKQTIDTEAPAPVPGAEGQEEIVAEEEDIEASPEGDVEISPEGEVSYGDDMDSHEAGETPEEEFEEEEFDHLFCPECEKEFGIEPDGQEAYHCPYCGGEVGGFDDAEGTDIDKDNPGAADELVGGDEVPAEAPAEPEVDEIAAGAIDPENVIRERKAKHHAGCSCEDCEEEMNENEMKTNPGIHPSEKAAIAKPTEKEIPDTGEKMKTDPDTGDIDTAEESEEELPDTGEKMKTNPDKRKKLMKPAAGTKISDSGDKMKTNPDIQKKLMDNATPTEKELPDTGKKMQTNPPTFPAEKAASAKPFTSLKESVEEMFGKKKGCECGVEGCQYGEEMTEGYEPGTAKGDILATYRSASNPDRRYYINRAKDGSVYCSCPAWRFQHKPASQRTCKHCEDYKSGGSGKVSEMIEGQMEEAIREGWTQGIGYPAEEGYPAAQQPAFNKGEGGEQTETAKRGFRFRKGAGKSSVKETSSMKTNPPTGKIENAGSEPAIVKETMKTHPAIGKMKVAKKTAPSIVREKKVKEEVEDEGKKKE